jgi:glycogen phosphorylase
MEPKKILSQNLPERLKGLSEIASNLWWSWHPGARMLFKRLDRQTWKASGHNPVKVLLALPGEALTKAAGDPEYLLLYDQVMAQFHRDLETGENCFTQRVPNPKDHSIAYFSAEYGLHRSLPFYAGGLGFLAGDYLKECSDLRVPLSAVGFMYPEGYLRQQMREDGWQENPDEILDRDAASITRVLDESGEQVVIRIPFIEPPIQVAVWKVAVGRTPLYLMDTDLPINDPWNRGISARLYIGDLEQRLRQEIVLGIGGYEVLSALGIRHTVLHLNEGHPAFALLERVRMRVQGGKPYEEALSQVRSTSVFTTHTPVAAGHDIFPFNLIEKYFRSYWPTLGVDHDTFLRLGMHPDGSKAGFNMTALALRLSGFCNGVSKKHGEVARRMWQVLWPGLPEEDVPISQVTNGVHVPTWVEPKLELLFNRYLGPEWLAKQDDPKLWERVEDVPDEELWKTHYWLKMKLINILRERARQRWAADRVSPSIILSGGTLLDPSVLTFGFARRFATYKRADLLFRDPERLKKILNDPWRPVQIIFAGKAHPADDPGKRMLQRVFQAAQDFEMGGRIAFVEDYGEQLAQYLVHGVDAWLNNPLPPMEACGTSGMKAALNGVPHLSILDGWWGEGYNGSNGWAFGREEGGGDGDREARDAESLYALLEDKVVPLYYQTADDGVPHGWVRIMKESIKSNAPRFCARRMVKEYIEKFYLKALQNA